MNIYKCTECGATDDVEDLQEDSLHAGYACNNCLAVSMTSQTDRRCFRFNDVDGESVLAISRVQDIILIQAGYGMDGNYRISIALSKRDITKMIKVLEDLTEQTNDQRRI